MGKGDLMRLGFKMRFERMPYTVQTDSVLKGIELGMPHDLFNATWQGVCLTETTAYLFLYGFIMIIFISVK